MLVDTLKHHHEHNRLVFPRYCSLSDTRLLVLAEPVSRVISVTGAMPRPLLSSDRVKLDGTTLLPPYCLSGYIKGLLGQLAAICPPHDKSNIL